MVTSPGVPAWEVLSREFVRDSPRLGRALSAVQFAGALSLLPGDSEIERREKRASAAI